MKYGTHERTNTHRHKNTHTVAFFISASLSLPCTSWLGWLTQSKTSVFLSPYQFFFSLCPHHHHHHHASWQPSSHLQEINFVPLNQTDRCKNPQMDWTGDSIKQKIKKANWGWQNAEQQPANWLQEGWDGLAAVVVRERAGLSAGAFWGFPRLCRGCCKAIHQVYFYGTMGAKPQAWGEDI